MHSERCSHALNVDITCRSVWWRLTISGREWCYDFYYQHFKHACSVHFNQHPTPHRCLIPNYTRHSSVPLGVQVLRMLGNKNRQPRSSIFRARFHKRTLQPGIRRDECRRRVKQRIKGVLIIFAGTICNSYHTILAAGYFQSCSDWCWYMQTSQAASIEFTFVLYFRQRVGDNSQIGRQSFRVRTLL